MVPVVDILMDEIQETEYPTKTYKIEVENNCMSGYVDDLEAIQQAIYLILNTERYEHLIYSWDYGIELIDLIGQPMPYVMSEVPRRVEEALTQDDRILEVKDFEFDVDKNKLHTTFTVVTVSGDINTELEVTM
jgi:phage baseplate assembly protein W